MSQIPSITIKMRAYFSTYHLWAAKHFLKLTQEIENTHTGRPKFDIKHRSYITSAIFSSVAFMEAAINEFFQDIFEQHKPYISVLTTQTQTAIAKFWNLMEEHDIRHRSRFNILEKYQLALTFAQEETFKKDKNPYQNAYLVITLRNALIHYKPQTLGGDDIHYLETKLKGLNFAHNKLMTGSGNPFFPDKCLGHGCAQWAVTSCQNLTDSFFNKLRIEPNYQKASFKQTF